MDDTGGVVFNKKARRGNIRRKNKNEEEEEEEGDGAKDDVRARLEEMKREQKYRARGSGVDAETLLTAGRNKKDPGSTMAALDEAGGESLLDSQFSAENEGVENLTVMDQQRNEYIDKQMSKGKAQEPAQKLMTAYDELYVIPDNMKIKGKEQELIENSAETWLTGIVEVELSMEDKLKNIEETENAKKQMLENIRKGVSTSAFRVDTSTDKGYQRMDQKEKKKGGRKADVKSLTDNDKRILSLPGSTNFNANFHLSGPVQAQPVDKAAQPAQTGQAPKRNEMSSDDLVMEKFKKRFRR